MATNPTSSSLETLKSRVDEAAEIMRIKPARVVSLLAELGVDQDEAGVTLLAAETTKEEDAKPIFVDKGGVPVAKFRLGWAILKGETKATAAKSETSKRPVTQWSDEDVVAMYGPDAQITIIAEMKKRGDDRRFIVFNKDGNVDVETTVTLLRLSRRQAIPDTYQVKGELVRVYRVGEFPMVKFEECPLHGEVLLVDGYCDKCKMSWTKVSDDTRVLVRVAKMAIPTFADDVEKRLSLIFSAGQVKMLYDELRQDGKLPILTRRTSSSRNGSADPFFVHRTY
jgi:hypothetical protein